MATAADLYFCDPLHRLITPTISELRRNQQRDCMYYLNQKTQTRGAFPGIICLADLAPAYRVTPSNNVWITQWRLHRLSLNPMSVTTQPDGAWSASHGVPQCAQKLQAASVEPSSTDGDWRRLEADASVQQILAVGFACSSK